MIIEKSHIYKVTNIVNNKIYVGMTKNFIKRKGQHFIDSKNGCNYVFHKAIRKYSEDNFNWEIIWTGEKNCAASIEKMFIDSLNTYYLNGKGYNMTFGGEGNNGKKSEKTRKRMSEARKGMKLSSTHKKNIGISGRNKDKYSFINLDNRIENDITQYEMYTKHNLDSSALYKVCKGDFKTIKGWKLIITKK